MEKNLPEKKFRAGAVSATIWKNNGKRKTGEETTFNTISLDRIYKDKEGNWKSTGTLRLSDLPKANLVLTKAYEYLVLKDGSTTTNEVEEEIVM